MAKLELERGTDVLLLETGDALLLEMMEHEVDSDIDTGIAVNLCNFFLFYAILFTKF